MRLSRDELLQPVLRDTTIPYAPYSVRTTLVTSLAGGPLAAIAIIAVNSLRLGRLARDLVPLALALGVFLGLTYVLAGTEWGAGLRANLQHSGGAHAVAIVYRALAAAFWGLGFVLHSKEQRTADFVGFDRPNGWVVGLACVAGGIMLQIALIAFVSGGVAL